LIDIGKASSGKMVFKNWLVYSQM